MRQSGEICEHRATIPDILIYSLSTMILKAMHHQLFVGARLAGMPLWSGTRRVLVKSALHR